MPCPETPKNHFGGNFSLSLGLSYGPKVTEPNLRFPAVFCENLRFSAKICGFLRFPAPSKCLNFQEKGRICENLRFSAKICVLGSLCHLSSVPLSTPRISAIPSRGRSRGRGGVARISCGEKKPIKKNHIKEFGGRMPRRRPRDKLGTSQGHLGHLGLIYVLINTKGKNVPGTDRTHHGTDGTCPWDRRDAHQGCPAKILYVYWFFSFPISNRNAYQTNSPEFEVGNGKNYQYPQKTF